MNAKSYTIQTRETSHEDSVQVLLMLYDGSIEFLKKAMEYGETGDTKNKNLYTQRANEIIIELDNVLSPTADVRFTKNMKLLYSFMNRHLIEAMTSNTGKGLADVAGMLKDLRESWCYVNDSLKASMAA